MKEILLKILGKKNYLKLEAFKKAVFPTAFDRQQQKFTREQLEFYRAVINRGDLCFDVGANVGFKTGVFLQLGARVVALEPQQHCVDILRAKYGAQVTILQKGAGAVNEVKDFYVSNHSALSSFDGNWVDELSKGRFAGSKVQSVERIEIVTLDSLITQFGKPQFIKIDVEGFETEVLKGLSKPFGCLSFEYAVPEKINGVVSSLELLQQKFNHLQCNYAIENNSSFALHEWLSIEQMLEFVRTIDFTNSFAGDVYVRNIEVV